MVVDAIVASTRQRLDVRKAERPIENLFEGLSPSNRSFEHALGGTAPASILEVKPASPSHGMLRRHAALRPVISAYARFASAVSVLTEPLYFGGSFELLRQVRAAVPQPVLCKDFVVDPYQVVEARYHGADAVLLMLSVIDDATWTACAAMASRLCMGVLTEVHTLGEMRRATSLRARIIGINNRDLASLRTDPERTVQLAPYAPRDAILISESGIQDRRTFERVRHCVDGVLVGSALMAADDPAFAVRALVHGETKICGLTREVDVQAAFEVGATHGGLVFYQGSRRAVGMARAHELVRAAAMRWVGVFVNESPERVGELAADLGLAAVQLHGEESVATVCATRSCVPLACEVWKGVRVRRGGSLPSGSGADLVLFDGFAPHARGGTGASFDWAVLRAPTLPVAYGVAGGLTVDNVQAASRLGARILDVSSGVEAMPGVKDHALLRAFMERRRGTRRQVAAHAEERVA